MTWVSVPRAGFTSKNCQVPVLGSFLTFPFNLIHMSSSSTILFMEFRLVDKLDVFESVV